MKNINIDDHDDVHERTLKPECQTEILKEDLHQLSFRPTQRRWVKILARQTLQRLPLLPAQVQARNTSENLLNEIRQIVYSLSRTKQISEKVNNNLFKAT